MKVGADCLGTRVDVWRDWSMEEVMGRSEGQAGTRSQMPHRSCSGPGAHLRSI